MPEVTEETREKIKNVRKRVGLNLLVSAVLPAVLYPSLKYLGVSSFTTVAIVVAIPAVWTIFLWISKRQANWLGLFSVFTVIVAYTISLFTGGNTILLKVNGDFTAAVLGFALLLSAIIGKPLLVPFVELIAPDMKQMNLLEKVNAHPGSRKRIAWLTAGIGSALLVNAVVDITLAFTLSTEAFIITSKIVSWTIIGLILIMVYFARRGAIPKQ